MAHSKESQLGPVQELQSEQQRKLLDAIDTLRSTGLGRYTDLPQLIVCGGQSTGKSSVLEALSGVPFPRHASLCTRFASEVVLRREPTCKMSVAIVPGPKRTGQEKKDMESFGRSLKGYEELPSIFKQAEIRMGLSDSVMKFTEDILRVEVSGPTQPQLTLVDLPGLFETTIDAQDPEDVKMVNNIVNRYMMNPRSIILAIVQATAHFQTQKVLNKARKIDSTGERTLGIITKPDRLDKGSSEERVFLDLARNAPIHLKLGWHAVLTLKLQDIAKILESRNDKGDVSSANTGRDEQEDVWFRKHSSFRPDPDIALGIGVASLRIRLSKLLLDQISDTIYPLRQEINRDIEKYSQELKRLGEERSDRNLQLAFLISLSSKFRQLCREAVRGDYVDPFFHNNKSESIRLCAVLRNKHDAFAKHIKEAGATWNIVSFGDFGTSERDRTRTQAIEAAVKILRDNRGRELLGYPTPDAVQILFQEYSARWEESASIHILDCRRAIENFVTEVLNSLTDTEISEKIRELVLEDAFDVQLKNAQSELQKLVAVHRRPPLTTNPRFLEFRQKLDRAKTKEDIAENLEKSFAARGQRRADEVLDTVRAYDRSDDIIPESLAAETALETMEAFYEIASDLFIDNVPTLAIWAPMVYQLEEMFTPESVPLMPSDTIHSIAAESVATTSKRQELRTRLDILRKGREECEKQLSKSALSRRSVNAPDLPNIAKDTSLSTAISQPFPIRAPSGPLVFAQQSSLSNPSAQPASSRTSQTLSPAGQRVGEPAKSSAAASSKSRTPEVLFSNSSSSTPGSAGLFGGTGNKKATDNSLSKSFFGTSANSSNSARGGESPSIFGRMPENPGFGQPGSGTLEATTVKSNTNLFGSGALPSGFGAPQSGFGARQSSLTPGPEDKRSKSASPSLFGLSPYSERNTSKEIPEDYTNSDTNPGTPPFSDAFIEPFKSHKKFLNYEEETFQHISAHPLYEQFSAEEVRLADYSRGQR